MKTNELMLYKDLEHEHILRDMTFLIEEYQNEYYNKKDLKGLLFEVINQLLELSNSHGFTGDLWQNYLTFLLVNHENAYSTSCEIIGEIDGSINEIALHDFSIFKELFDYNFNNLERELGVHIFPILTNYKNPVHRGKVFNKRITNHICGLSKKLNAVNSAESFKKLVTAFYKSFGVGKFGLHKAFRIDHMNDETHIMPITNIAHVQLDDLIGAEIPKKKLVDNTKAFIQGKKANNCLLFGDSGTGKSSSVKAILNQYYDQGLRMIEVHKHQFQDLNHIIGQIKNRNYKFIIYMDDLSFEEFEVEYKYLKAVIEGGLEKKPENVLIYATSNRRHIVREQFSDKEERRDDLHASDTVQEKLSLSARFGVSIFFVGPSKKEYEEIVIGLAKKAQISMKKDELLLEANKWELSHGGRSGRTAQQFIDYLLGIL